MATGDQTRRDGMLNFWGLVLAAVITTGGGVYIGVQQNRFQGEKERLQATIDSLEKQRAVNTGMNPSERAECQDYKDQIEDLRAQLKRAQSRQDGPPTLASQSQEVEGFTFDLNACSLEGDEVKCDLLVTAKNQDRLLTFWGTSRLVEHDGKEIFASRIRLGNTDGQGGNYRQVQKELTRDVPFKMGVAFAGVNPSVSGKSVKLIELVCSGLKVPFRNVGLK